VNLTLTEPQARAHAEYAEFATRQIAPLADAIDREARVPRSLIAQLAAAGCLASGLPTELGGGPVDPVVHGLMHEALGAASASVQGLVNVHHMAASALARWGTRAQKQRWLPRLGSGELLAAFALTEPGAGSDGQVATRAARAGDHYRLTGTKRWITAGALADVFLVFARGDDGPAAFMVPADAAGLSRTPIPGLLGCRGYMLASLELEDCRIPVDDRIGAEGFGLSHVLATGLDHGRHNLAWSCVGQAQACLDASIRYAEQRSQFGAPIASFQLVQRLLTQMIVGVYGARLLCWRAAQARGDRLPSALHETLIAKYQASTMLNEIADHALQIHGANGCGSEYPIQRYLRDARIMEIIEGSTQMLEIMIARLGGAGLAPPDAVRQDGRSR
jgi:alkylation response protein AidB-like acyl-CoA dehydrogenase